MEGRNRTILLEREVEARGIVKPSLYKIERKNGPSILAEVYSLTELLKRDEIRYKKYKDKE